MLSEQPSVITELKLTGGARIGNANATWPFAQLIVSRDKLILNASLIGNLVFRPADIISIEPYSGGLKSGIKINHRVEKYKPLVAFLSSENAFELINKIKQTGFLDNKDKMPFYIDEEITTMQLSGGFPIKTSAAIAIVAMWNLLCLPSFFKAFMGRDIFPGIVLGPKWAIGFVLTLSILLLIVEPVQKAILKPGRTINDIKRSLYLLIVISSLMLTVWSLAPMPV